MRRFFNNIGFLVIIFSISLMAAKCKAQNTIDESRIENIKWMHSYEEDTNEVKVYRPDTYGFPPSRGRTGFQLNEDKSFINYEIAPADGIVERKGSCSIEGSKMMLSFEDSARDYIMELISIENNVLKIKK